MRPQAQGSRAVLRALKKLRFLGRRSRLVPLGVGLVLITAGILKTLQLWTEPMSEPAVIGSWKFKTALLIELELYLGLGLLLNLWPGYLRRVALVFFAIFTGVALSKAAAGARSCGCAGNVEIAPWVAVITDLAMLAGLWTWRPNHSPSASAEFKISPALLFLVVLPWPVLGAFRPPAYPELVVAPGIDLSQIGQGQRRTFTVTLRNPHDQAVEIFGLESSCPCLESKSVPTRIPPRGVQTLDLSLDLSHEPGFAGPLLLEVKGKTMKGVIAFFTQVATNVRENKRAGR